MAKGIILTATRLREVRTYDPDTGLFYQFKKMKGQFEVTGSPHNHGYVRLTVDWREYLAHNLAWLYMTGEWPEVILDHVNLIKSDNRWLNLRLSPGTTNRGNIGIMRTNTNGYTGTYFNKKTHRWQAQFRNKFLGSFDTQGEAALVYADAVRAAYGEFAHERFRPPATPRRKDSESSED